jgi:Flp pilus assembly protein TadG
MLSALRKFQTKLHHDDSGIAAVEFALILPLMLTIYMGLVELSRGMRAAQRVELVAHTLADLTAQQITGGTNSAQGQAGLTEADISSIFAAANVLLAPLPTNTLKMTISEVNISQTAPTTWAAKVNWTVTRNGGPVRGACGTALGAADAAPVSSNTMPTSYTTVTNGVNPTVGPVIVADVIYDYSPGVNFQFFKWGTSPTWTLKRTSYAPVRNTYSPPHIQYFMTTGTNCQAPTP